MNRCISANVFVFAVVFPKHLEIYVKLSFFALKKCIAEDEEETSVILVIYRV